MVSAKVEHLFSIHDQACFSPNLLAALQYGRMDIWGGVMDVDERIILSYENKLVNLKPQLDRKLEEAHVG